MGKYLVILLIVLGTAANLSAVYLWSEHAKTEAQNRYLQAYETCVAAYNTQYSKDTAVLGTQNPCPEESGTPCPQPSASVTPAYAEPMDRYLRSCIESRIGSGK